MKSTKTVESILYSLYGIVHVGLEEKFYNVAGHAGIAVGDLIGNAYAYVCEGVLAGKVKPPESGADLYRLVSRKAGLLLKDAVRAANCEHGRRSVRAWQSLDEIPGEGDRPLTDYASYLRYEDTRREDEEAFRRRIAVQTLHMVFERIDMTQVNRNIYLECVIEERPREAVAEKYGTTRNNTDAIVARVKKALAKYGPGIFEALSRTAA